MKLCCDFLLMMASANTVQRRLDDLGLQKKHIGIKSKKTSRNSEDWCDVHESEVDEAEAQKKRELVWRYCTPMWYKKHLKGSRRKSQAISKAIRERANYIISPYVI